MSNLIKTSVLALSLATFLPHLRMPAQQSSRIMKIASYYYHRDGFMGTVAVARHGELVFEQSYGYANLKPQAPFTPDTSFPIGSLSKQFTAAAILLLQEDGKLKTSDPIARFYKDAPAAWRRITLRNLLTQTSGIPDFDFSQAVRQGSRSPEETIRPLTAQPLKFEPGAGFDYANANYVLLGLVIEKVSGESYCRFLKLRIFDPVGLTHTGCGWRSGLIPHGASGYRPAAQGFVPAEDDDTTGISGAGSLYSTIGDLISWTTALHGGEVVNHSSLREMTTPFLNGYAYGLEVDGDKRIGHNGVIDGFSSSVDYLPKTKTVVVVLSNVNSPGNQSSPGAFAMEVELMQLATDERSILPSEGKELSLPEGTLRGYVGRYRAKDSHNPLSFAIDLRGNHLFLQLDGTVGSPAQLRAESQSDFYLADQEVEIDFDAPGSAVVTDYNAHTTTSFLRQGEPAVPGANP